MKTLKGVEVSVEIKEQVTQMTEGLEGLAPGLAIVWVREKPDDMFHERGAMKKMGNFGLRVRTYALPEQISDSDFKAEFSAINRDPDVSEILLLRPLPRQTAETDIEKIIDPEKDLDGISSANIVRVFAGDKTGFASCIAEAVIGVLEANEIDMTGKNVTTVGHSMVAGRPLSMPVSKKNATVTICHTRTRDLEAECRRAKILVAAVGKAKMLNGCHVGQDVIVIDVGTNVGEDGRICGDVDFRSIESAASTATPVPGGVRAVTTAVLVKHLVPVGQRQRRN